MQALDPNEATDILKAISKKYTEEGYDALTEAEKVVTCIDWINFEVMLGSFIGYYCNSVGDLAVDTVEALKAVKAFRLAEILSEANALFPGGQPSTDRETRGRQIDTFTEKTESRLQELAKEFTDNVADLQRLETFLIESGLAAIYDNSRPNL